MARVLRDSRAHIFFALDNYDITVFEKEERLGGMFTMGIPFRLEKEVVDAEIEVLKELGVKFKTGVEVGKDVTLDELRAQGYRGFYPPSARKAAGRSASRVRMQRAC